MKIMTGQQQRFVKKINVYNALTYFFLIMFCLPPTIAANSIIFVNMRRLGLVWVCYLLIINRFCRSRKMLPIYLWIIWVFFCTLVNRTDLGTTFSTFFPAFSVVVIVSYLIDKWGKRAIKRVSVIFSLILVGQFISIFTNTMGYDLHGDKIYFLGIRVQISSIFIFAIALALMSVKLGGRKEKFLLVVAVSSSLYFIFYEWVGTALTTITLFILILLFTFFIKNKKMLRNIAILSLVVCASFVLLGISTESFSWLLSDVLGKDLSLNGRTILWQSAIERIKGIHWIIGNGYAHDYLFTLPNGFFANTSHSQYTEILFCFGLIGFALYAYIHVLIVKSAMKIRDHMIRNIIFSLIISTAVMGISTSYYTKVYMYICFVILVNIDSMFRKKGLYGELRDEKDVFL